MINHHIRAQALPGRVYRPLVGRVGASTQYIVVQLGMFLMLGLALLSPSNAWAQQKVSICVTNPPGSSCAPVVTNPPGSGFPVLNVPLLHQSGASAGLTSLILKATPGNLSAYNCTGIAGAAAGFCVAYNGITAPATGALTPALVLDFCYFDTTARGCNLSHLPNSIAFGVGITLLITSAATPYTYTTGTDTGALEGDYY